MVSLDAVPSPATAAVPTGAVLSIVRPRARLRTVPLPLDACRR